MIPKINKVHSEDIGNLKTNSKRLFFREGKLNICLVYKLVPGEKFKVGVSVSKKASTKAVDRNRIKRIIYSFLEQNYLGPVDGITVMLYIRGGGGDESALLTAIKSLLHQVPLLKGVK